MRPIIPILHVFSRLQSFHLRWLKPSLGSTEQRREATSKTFSRTPFLPFHIPSIIPDNSKTLTPVLALVPCAPWMIFPISASVGKANRMWLYFSPPRNGRSSFGAVLTKGESGLKKSASTFSSDTSGKDVGDHAGRSLLLRPRRVSTPVMKSEVAPLCQEMSKVLYNCCNEIHTQNAVASLISICKDSRRSINLPRRTASRATLRLVGLRA